MVRSATDASIVRFDSMPNTAVEGDRRWSDCHLNTTFATSKTINNTASIISMARASEP